MTTNDLLSRATALKLYGLIEHWDQVCDATWLPELLTWEEESRLQRSLERRLRASRLSSFKTMDKFDWSWPKKCDREAIQDTLQLKFMAETSNVILCGPNGVGKTTIASNVAHQAVLRGYTVLFTTAAQMLNELASQDGDIALRRRIKFYAQPQLLIIDEVGYLSYSNRHADLLFEIISQRYQEKSILITTNKPFAEWGEIFPNASCVVSLIDRLVHHAEIMTIEAESFRLKEAKERGSSLKRNRRKAREKVEVAPTDTKPHD
jgi:DNA replication protein DnaC